MAGLRGDLGLGDWTWEVYGSHGSTRTDLDYIGFMSTRRLQAVATGAELRHAARPSPAWHSTSLTCTSGLPVFQDFQISEDCIRRDHGHATPTARAWTRTSSRPPRRARCSSCRPGSCGRPLARRIRKNEFQYLPDATRERNNIVDAIVGSFRPGQRDGRNRGQGDLRRAAGAGAARRVPRPVAGAGARATATPTTTSQARCPPGRRCSAGHPLTGCASAAATSSPTARRTSTSCSSRPAARRSPTSGARSPAAPTRAS